MSDIKDFVIVNGELKSYKGTDAEVIIPDGVTCFAPQAFLQSMLSPCTTMVSVTLPKSVVTIGREAFQNCTALRTIHLEDGITSIGSEAFDDCRSLETIEIPESVADIGYGAFSNCRSLTNVTIPNKVTSIEHDTFQNCISLTTITVPIGLTSIGWHAFVNCSNLREVRYLGSLADWVAMDRKNWHSSPINEGVTLFCNDGPVRDVVIPKGVTVIGDQAFSDNPDLTSVAIPEGVTMIGGKSFMHCVNLENVALPDSLTTIDERAFFRCNKLSTIVLPETVKYIGESAFEECENLTSVSFSGRTYVENNAFKGCKSLASIDMRQPISMHQNSFQGCWSLRHVRIKEGLKTKQPLESILCSLPLGYDDNDCAWMFLFQKGKIWREWINEAGRIHNPERTFGIMMGLLEAEEKIPKAMGLCVGDFIGKYQGQLSDEIVWKMLALLERKKSPALSSLKEMPEIKRYFADNGDSVEENPVEAFVREKLREQKPDVKIEAAIKKGIHYLNSKEICTKSVIIYLIWQYAMKYYAKPDQEADYVAAALDPTELSDLLTRLVKGSNYGLYLRAWARYTEGNRIHEVVDEHIHMSRGKVKCDKKGGDMYEALLLSDTREAMHLFEKNGDLDRYARMHGMAAMEVRDSMMLPAFDFDADGVKRYDIGGNTIEVSIAPDLSFRLYDVNKQKEIRSFPKKSDDPTKAEARAKEFAFFKKEVLAFAKERTELLHKMHMSGEYVGADLWQKVYVEHPVIAKIARLVVWQDEAGKTFMIADDGIIDSQSSAYAPKGKIRVAHVLDMDAADIAAWQQWLAKRGCVQLFEQIWEPVIRYDAKSIADRYSGVTFTNEERNAVKKALKLRGVDIRADEMDREYNHRAGGWVYSNEGAMLFGKCMRVDYTVDEKTKAITFGKASTYASTGNREMNATLLEMDKATLSAQITRDNDTALTDQALSVFSAAQIAGLLNLAIDHKATRCTARLLDYKNAHFPEFAGVNEFSLDW